MPLWVEHIVLSISVIGWIRSWNAYKDMSWRRDKIVYMYMDTLQALNKLEARSDTEATLSSEGLSDPSAQQLPHEGRD